GTAMAIYFFAMYVLGASLGPLGTGFFSDLFTRRAAVASGVFATTAALEEATTAALEPFKAEGLHTAMYLVPVLGLLLGVVLAFASMTVSKDMHKLQEWMRNCAKTPEFAAPVEPEKAEAAGN